MELNPIESPAVVRSDLAGIAAIRRVLPGYVAGLARDVRLLDEGMAAGRRNDVRRLAHQLKGSGGSYGFPDISRLAAVVESALDAKRPLADVAADVAALVGLIRRVDGFAAAA